MAHIEDDLFHTLVYVLNINFIPNLSVYDLNIVLVPYTGMLSCSARYYIIKYVQIWATVLDDNVSTLNRGVGRKNVDGKLERRNI